MSPTVIENTYNSVRAAGSYGSWPVSAVPCSCIQGLLFNLFFLFFFFFFPFCSDCASVLCKPDFYIIAAFGSGIYRLHGYIWAEGGWKKYGQQKLPRAEFKN